MGEHSNIEWTDHTFSPWWGCTKVSAACTHCYAEAWAKRTGHDVWGDKSPRRFFADAHWQEPLKWNKKAEGVRRKVFCASMADVFEDRPDLVEPRARLFTLIEATPHLDWLLLTKRPENIRPLAMLDLGFDPGTVWLGTTLESSKEAARADFLTALPSKYRFLSCEPLLGTLAEVDLCPYGPTDWIICGGESGPGARPMHPTWATELRDRAVSTGTAFFFKQWGDWEPMTPANAFLDGVLEMDSKEWKGMLSGVALVGYGGEVTLPERPYEKWLVEQSHKTAAEWEGPEHHQSWAMHRVGKKIAGRVLDARTWSEFPDGGAGAHSFIEEILPAGPSRRGARRHRRCTACGLSIGVYATGAGRCQPRPDAAPSKHQLDLLS